MTEYNFILTLNKINIKVILGLEQYEKISSREVEIYIKFFFQKPPLSCQNDDINHTICYNEVCQLIVNHCKNKDYNLIEHLSYDIHQILKAKYHQANLIAIKILKTNPLMNNVLGDATFEYVD